MKDSTFRRPPPLDQRGAVLPLAMVSLLVLSAVLLAFGAKMRNAGVKEPIIRKILHDNPTRFLAFVPKNDARG